jgi:DNA-binding NtrC family response regulator
VRAHGIELALMPNMKKPPIRILFVEDDAEMIATYQENFTQPEYETRSAQNGSEALKVLQNSQPFDVMVADNYMPEMTGMDLLKEVQEKYPHLKVIMVTAYGNWTDYIEAFNRGVTKFFDKPLKPGQLKRTIKDLLKTS